jgi:hypothetical protein
VSAGDAFGVPIPASMVVTLDFHGRRTSLSGIVPLRLTDGRIVETFPLRPGPSVSLEVIPCLRKTAFSPAPGIPRLRVNVMRGALGEPGFK